MSYQYGIYNNNLSSILVLFTKHYTNVFFSLYLYNVMTRSCYKQVKYSETKENANVFFRGVLVSDI